MSCLLHSCFILSIQRRPTKNLLSAPPGHVEVPGACESHHGWPPSPQRLSVAAGDPAGPAEWPRAAQVAAKLGTGGGAAVLATGGGGSFRVPCWMVFRILSGWRFGIFFLFFHIFGIIIPIDSYFSEGWNHQPVFRILWKCMTLGLLPMKDSGKIVCIPNVKGPGPVLKKTAPNGSLKLLFDVPTCILSTLKSCRISVLAGDVVLILLDWWYPHLCGLSLLVDVVFMSSKITLRPLVHTVLRVLYSDYIVYLYSI